MASEGTDSRTNSLTNRSSSSQHNDDDLQPQELKGWLMKRTKLSRKWKKQWFLLKSTSLLYGNSPEDTEKQIPLTNSEISESIIDKKQHAFCIKSKENGRSYYIQADNENLQNEWMQAICFAKAAGQRGDNSQACVIQ
ncbi:PH domain-containing protein DDB_G0274775-like [Mya arenaria]|nr:PH domain-containing protein DDB_G0274775-like [Mya arenaria]